MTYAQRYRQGRDLQLSRRHAAISALPTRLHVFYALLRGRPIAYRISIEHGVLTVRERGTIVAESTVTDSPSYGITYSVRGEFVPDPPKWRGLP